MLLKSRRYVVLWNNYVYLITGNSSIQEIFFEKRISVRSEKYKGVDTRFSFKDGIEFSEKTTMQ